MIERYLHKNIYRCNKHRNYHRIKIFIPKIIPVNVLIFGVEFPDVPVNAFAVSPKPVNFHFESSALYPIPSKSAKNISGGFECFFIPTILKRAIFPDSNVLSISSSTSGLGVACQ